jgi:phosphate acetyltransferase
MYVIFELNTYYFEIRGSKMSEFLDEIIKKAKADIKKIAFDEIDDERIIKAVVEINNQKLAIPVLVGSKIIANETAKKAGVDISNITIIDQTDFSELDFYSNKLFELRKNKGMTLDQAKDIMKSQNIYFATMLLEEGVVDGLVSGAAKATADSVRPSLQIVKTKEGINTASSYFLMLKDSEVLFFADCGFNIDPNEEQLAEIAITTNDTSKFLGLKDPKIAMLSFSTKGSAKHPMVDKVVNATKLVEEKRSDILIEGELQFDAAYVESVAAKKCPNSKLGGAANIFVFPDLNSGNIAYKVAQRLGNFQAIGPILQGLKKPMNDLSRGCNVQDIVDLCAITSVMSQKN